MAFMFRLEQEDGAPAAPPTRPVALQAAAAFGSPPAPAFFTGLLFVERLTGVPAPDGSRAPTPRRARNAFVGDGPLHRRV
jgi:hypothetical protein